MLLIPPPLLVSCFYLFCFSFFPITPKKKIVYTTYEIYSDQFSLIFLVIVCIYYTYICIIYTFWCLRLNWSVRALFCWLSTRVFVRIHRCKNQNEWYYMSVYEKRLALRFYMMHTLQPYAERWLTKSNENPKRKIKKYNNNNRTITTNYILTSKRNKIKTHLAHSKGDTQIQYLHECRHTNSTQIFSRYAFVSTSTYFKITKCVHIHVYFKSLLLAGLCCCAWCVSVLR